MSHFLHLGHPWKFSPKCEKLENFKVPENRNNALNLRITKTKREAQVLGKLSHTFSTSLDQPGVSKKTIKSRIRPEIGRYPKNVVFSKYFQKYQKKIENSFMRKNQKCFSAHFIYTPFFTRMRCGQSKGQNPVSPFFRPAWFVNLGKCHIAHWTKSEQWRAKKNRSQ